MGASCGIALAPNTCGNACAPCTGPGALQKYHNCKVVGLGGDLVTQTGRVVCVVVAFDYEGYPAEENAGCGPLSCIPDGQRFAALAAASGAETIEFYDNKRIHGSQGFPHKDAVLEELRRVGAFLGAGDTLVFFYAGHGTQTKDRNGDEEDGMDEQLCFVEPDGSPNFLVDDEISSMLLRDFKSETRVLFITDCCHSGTVCDLNRDEFRMRPICHLSAVRDHQCAEDLGDGGAFTSSLLETIEDFSQDAEMDYSLVEVFNACYGKYNDMEDTQDFKFERTLDFDPDTFAWPLIPPQGWSVRTLLDRKIRVGSKYIDMPFDAPRALREAGPRLPVVRPDGVSGPFLHVPFASHKATASAPVAHAAEGYPRTIRRGGA